MLAELNHYERRFISDFSDAMLACVTDRDGHWEPAMVAYRAVSAWLAANGRTEMPVGVFMKLTLVTGYSITRKPYKRIHGIRLNTT
ncbi:hypothetical protein ACWCXB_10420 [Streptomyces sp. NPDC001514]